MPYEARTYTAVVPHGVAVLMGLDRDVLSATPAWFEDLSGTFEGTKTSRGNKTAYVGTLHDTTGNHPMVVFAEPLTPQEVRTRTMGLTMLGKQPPREPEVQLRAFVYPHNAQA